MTSHDTSEVTQKELQEATCNGNSNAPECEKTTTGIITEQPTDRFSHLGPPPPYTEYPQTGLDPMLLAEGHSQIVNNVQVNPDDEEEERRKREEQRRRNNNDDYFCCFCCYSEPSGLYTAGDGVTYSRYPSQRCCGDAHCCNCWGGGDCAGCCDCGDCGDCGNCDCGDCDCGGCADCAGADCGNCLLDCNIS